MSDFIQLCLSREAAPDDIDNFIDLWHQNPGTQALHEFLGMSWEEYARWVADGAVLQAIINSRKSPAAS